MRTFSSVLIAAVTTATVSVASAQVAPEPEPEPEPAAPSPPPTPSPSPSPSPPPPPSPSPPPSVAVEPAKKPDIELKPGGYLQVDGKAFFEEDSVDDFQIKRLRPKLDGVAYGHFPFRVLLDLAGSRIQVLDAWVEVDYTKAAVLRFGKDKQQFGLERLQSATALTFIERGLPTQLVPNRDVGAQLRGDIAGGVAHYALGVFDGTPDITSVDAESDDHLELNGRLFVQPFKSAGPAAVKGLGVGGAFTYGRVVGVAANPQLASYRSTGGATIFRWAASTTDPAATVLADGIRFRATAHGTWYWKRLGALAEYVRAEHGVVLRGSHAKLAHQSWQAVASVLVTDDEASFKGVKPRKPFSPGEGIGAIELAARYSELAIDPDSFDLGYASAASSVENARAFAVGANWYLNSALKLQLNYEVTAFEGGAADGADRETENAVLVRAQVQI